MGEAKRRRQSDPTFGSTRRLTRARVASIRDELLQLDGYVENCRQLWDNRELFASQPIQANLIRKKALKVLLGVNFPYLDWDKPETWTEWFFRLENPLELSWEQIRIGIEQLEREAEECTT